jgi:hypothetical protein
VSILQMSSPEQAETVKQMLALQRAGRPQSEVLNGYLAMLIQHDWTRETISTVLDTSHQNISSRVRRGKQWLHLQKQPFQELHPDLPVVQGPGREPRPALPERETQSGLHVPNDEAIRAAAAAAMDEELDPLAAPLRERLDQSQEHSDETKAMAHQMVRAAEKALHDAEQGYAEARKLRAEYAWSLLLHRNRKGLARAGHWWPLVAFTKERNERLSVTTKEFNSLDAAGRAALAERRGVSDCAEDTEPRFREATETMLASLARAQRAKQLRDWAIGQWIEVDATSGRNQGVLFIANEVGLTEGAVSHIVAKQRRALQE